MHSKMFSESLNMSLFYCVLTPYNLSAGYNGD